MPLEGSFNQHYFTASFDLLTRFVLRITVSFSSSLQKFAVISVKIKKQTKRRQKTERMK